LFWRSRDEIGSCKKITDDGREQLKKSLEGIASLKKLENKWEWEDE